MKNFNIKINLCIHYISALGVGVASLGYIETTPRIQALGTFKHLAHSSTWHI